MNRRLPALSSLSCCSLAAAPLGAEPPRRAALAPGAPASQRRRRPAGTPSARARRCAGSPPSSSAPRSAGSEIHRLNPGIADPDRIAPGLRIRIPAVLSSFPAARLNRLSRQVEDQPSPIPWHNAQVGDVLVERDGVRTHQKSSAEMQFLDGARLTVTEDSLIFLHRSGNTLRGTPKKSIEIVQGQAELERPVGVGGGSAPRRWRSWSAPRGRPRGRTARGRRAPAPARPRRGAPS